ncbi:MAG: aspartate--tRNA ligase [Candidatus Liptonbacteria bacterium]|nr:aspartate--tRNA ligase [Candidatus Liptonbacteria bacterium]
MRTPISEVKNNEGKELEFSGWVHARRDHGKIIFIDLRDRSGSVQVVLTPAVSGAGDLRLEYVVKITGLVKARPEKMVSKDQANGAHELEAKTLEILNPAGAMPISVDTDGMEIDEEARMKYRYLDIRRERLKNNLIKRHAVNLFLRNFLDKEGFLEIETPILTKSTPEGARDYLVPSRIYQGKFYALPQSPQQYKQLLMVAGLEKYFQIARCFRDEDTRGDRQPEFTQLDLEISFVEREDVIAVNEKLLIELVEKLYPGKKIQEKPFPRFTYAEAMEKYGNDRPDLRKDKSDPNLLAFCWVVDFPFFERVAGGNEAHPELVERAKSGSTGSPQTSNEVWTFTHNPFSAPKPEFMEDLLAKKNIGEILTTQYDVALNGMEIGGGSIRNHRPEALKAVFEIMGFPEERINANFGHMLEALSFGAPPHGGIAWGLDRLVSILQNEPNIREVIPFPKTGDGRDPMMDSPSSVEKTQLEELGLEIKTKSKKT